MERQPKSIGISYHVETSDDGINWEWKWGFLAGQPCTYSTLGGDWDDKKALIAARDYMMENPQYKQVRIIVKIKHEQ